MASSEDYWIIIVSGGNVSFKAIVTRSEYPPFRLSSLFDEGIVAKLLAKGKKVVVELHLIANRGKVYEYHAHTGFKGAVAWLVWVSISGRQHHKHKVNPQQLNIQLAEIVEFDKNPIYPK